MSIQPQIGEGTSNTNRGIDIRITYLEESLMHGVRIGNNLYNPVSACLSCASSGCLRQSSRCNRSILPTYPSLTLLDRVLRRHLVKP
ncbi:hypothetical protein VNO77_38978 [Canavalia gladiata]|uniref:Uncharacterized protein n=1 Tax=Canavalia gladiata TaxID=3824 RepID=A0AAN9KDK6_CANGL